MKKCTVCEEEKPLSAFYKMKASKDGHGYRCKTCDNTARKKWKEKNPLRSAYSERNRRLKYVYGIDIPTYEKMFKEQNHCCAICGASENSTVGERKDWNFAVDHCHKTGSVRGLLCNSCNRALGLFQDNPEFLSKAITYLSKGI